METRPVGTSPILNTTVPTPPTQAGTPAPVASNAPIQDQVVLGNSQPTTTPSPTPTANATNATPAQTDPTALNASLLDQAQKISQAAQTKFAQFSNQQRLLTDADINSVLSLLSDTAKQLQGLFGQASQYPQATQQAMDFIGYTIHDLSGAMQMYTQMAASSAQHAQTRTMYQAQTTQANNAAMLGSLAQNQSRMSTAFNAGMNGGGGYGGGYGGMGGGMGMGMGMGGMGMGMGMGVGMTTPYMPGGYGYGQPGYTPGYGTPGYGVPGYGIPSYGTPGYGAPGYAGYPPAYPPAYPPPPPPPPPPTTTNR